MLCFQKVRQIRHRVVIRIHNDHVGIIPILPPPFVRALPLDDLPPEDFLLVPPVEAPALFEPFDNFLYLFLYPPPARDPPRPPPL